VPAPLQLAFGKLVTAPPAIYTSPSPSGADLIFLKDSVSHTNYLVDTGAAISLLPFNSSSAATGPAIVNANGSAIPSWNFVRKQLKFGKHSFVHSFLQAKVSQPILGLDFLSRHGISVDCKASRVLFPQPKPLPVFATTPPPRPPPPIRPSRPPLVRQHRRRCPSVRQMCSPSSPGTPLSPAPRSLPGPPPAITLPILSIPLARPSPPAHAAFLPNN
jgi:hypothetical protein